ncbi:MAG: site-specific DNA-methyltransferase [Alphaproteobacteria bacterium]|nr:site-specific DNA-methyltransferase [Alphaproteobacteria bacterium]
MPIKYISHVPNTVQGQAVLDNVVRTRRILKYRDNERVFDRIKRGLPLYEVDKIESVGNNPKNLVIRGECLSACAYLKDKGIKVDLVYIDPPFASGADYAKKVYIRRNPKLAEKIAKAEEQLDLAELRAFEEKMYGDIWNKEDYLNWMYENLVAIKSIMNDTASIYVHLDWHIGHYVKILMDEVFGEDNFLNEIVWFYRSGGASKEGSIARKHDAIYFFKKNENFKINTIYERQYLENPFMGSKQDENGKFYVDTILTDTINGIVNRVLPDGKIIEYNTRPVLNLSTERLDYNTQKPEGLLNILIEIASKKGMIVADFFGGSGVTAKVAHDLKRNFIHVDVGLNSIQTVRDRLKLAQAEFDIFDVKDGVALFRNPIQTMDKLKTLIPGLHNQEDLNSFWIGALNNSKLGLVPVYIPNLLDHSTKVLDMPFMNRILNEAMPDLPENIKQVIIYYIDIDDENQLKNFIKEYNNTNINIELRDLKIVLDEVVLNDYLEYELNHTEIICTKFISDRLMQKIDEYNQKKVLSFNKKLLFENNSDRKHENSIDAQNLESELNDDAVSEKKLNKKNYTPIEISEHGLELIEMISLDCTNTDGIWQSDFEIKIDKNSFVCVNGKKTKEFWNGKISYKKKPFRLKVRNIAGDETIINII